jgi:hypothetical protein
MRLVGLAMHPNKYSVNAINTGSANCEAVGRQARLAGNGRVLAKRRNTADDRFTIRPEGTTRMIQNGVTVLEKDRPFSAHCALSWIIRVVLNPYLSH